MASDRCFNLYKYRLEGAFYQENGLEVKTVSFKAYKKEQVGDGQSFREVKVLKEVSYDVLFDKQTKTYVPISSIRKYAFENDITLIDRFRHAYAVPNADMRALLENPEYRTLRQINRAMRERGYTVEQDSLGNYGYTRAGSTFTMDRRDLMAFTGYAKDRAGERQQQKPMTADKAAGMLGGSLGNRVVNEILGDNFRTERMIAGNAKKVVSVVKNPANIKMMLIRQIGSFLNPFKEL